MLQRINTSLFTHRSFFYVLITGNRLEMLLLYADNCVPLLVFGKCTRGDTSSIKGLHSWQMSRLWLAADVCYQTWTSLRVALQKKGCVIWLNTHFPLFLFLFGGTGGGKHAGLRCNCRDLGRTYKWTSQGHGHCILYWSAELTSFLFCSVWVVNPDTLRGLNWPQRQLLWYYFIPGVMIYPVSNIPTEAVGTKMLFVSRVQVALLLHFLGTFSAGDWALAVFT